MSKLFDNLFPPPPPADGEPPQILTSGLRCDRCGSNNAIRMMFATSVDTRGEKVYEPIDVCSHCLVAMNSALLGTLAQNKRGHWIKNFIGGVIQG